ncbi:MAG: hypothetical protein M9931_04195 [Chitinophagales bacterium]|nr:hypothetical protein [Chitinophagales bacterium]MCO5280244.1 hypothetical protein [Chitinophagales bacterium]OJV25251.1 MAG: hypothetical protein BGO32_04770 [Bacteroidetes bacterium 37-13]HRN94607.1 hypothetical protein [Chitinophagales bacterium]HRP39414.1 hypothetical protein [Chitinophagales bacterium]
MKFISIAFTVCFLTILNLQVSAKDKPTPKGEMLSIGYLSTNSFANALLKYKEIEDALKVNSTDQTALWNLGLSYFVIANNDKNYINRCLAAWDNYLRLYPNDGFALWNRGFVKHYFNVGTPCADIQAATQNVKKKYLPKSEDFKNCFKKKK